MVEEIVTTSWEILESNEQEKKEKRLETAGWKSLTARVSNWKIEDDCKDKHQSDKKRMKEWQHTDSPSKKARGGKGVRQGSMTTSPDLPAEKKGPVKAIEAKTDSGGPKKSKVRNGYGKGMAFLAGLAVYKQRREDHKHHKHRQEHFILGEII